MQAPHSQVKWWWNLPVVLLLGTLISLGIRTLATGDSRYGWGTFARQTIYELHYHWEFEDGSTQSYRPGNELRGDARKLLKARKQRNTRYGFAAIPIWIDGYSRYMWERRPPGAIAFHTRFRYEMGKARTERISQDASVMKFRYPPLKSVEGELARRDVSP